MILQDSFQDQIVLVTGGGSGIGFSIAQQFLSNGSKVIITGRNEEKLQRAVDKLQDAGEVTYQICDIREQAHIQQLADYIKEKYGKLDILINNAGGQFPSLAKDLSFNGWTSVINNNLNGTFYMTQMMANAFFLPQQKGNIVNIIANIFKGFPGMSHTGAARAGVDNLTKSLAIEWARQGIKINAVAPGIIQSTGLERYPQELVEGIAKTVPVNALGSTDDVAHAVLFLASPYAKFITGETLYVDGGQRLWGDVFTL